MTRLAKLRQFRSVCTNPAWWLRCQAHKSALFPMSHYFVDETPAFLAYDI